KAYQFLTTECNEKTHAIIGYELAKTLSENGTVSRGVCQADASGNLVAIAERTKIYRDGNRIVYEDSGEKVEVPNDSSVSMNFWCFHPSIFPFIEQLFSAFLSKQLNDPKAEFFIPIIGDAFIHEHKGVIKVIPTAAQWFGVTY